MGMMDDGIGPWMMGGGGFGPAMCAMTVRDNAKGMLAHCTAATMGSREGAGPSLTDRMDWHEQFLTAQLDAVRAMNKALKPLYASLNEEKKTANQMFWGPMGMM
jgi:hypothetical protein